VPSPVGERERGTGNGGRPVSPKPAVRTGPSQSTIARRLYEIDKEMARQRCQRDDMIETLAGTIDHIELSHLGLALTAAQASLEDVENR